MNLHMFLRALTGVFDMFQTTSLSTILQVYWEQDLEQPLHISHTAQEITAYFLNISVLEITKQEVSLLQPSAKNSVWTCQRAAP